MRILICCVWCFIQFNSSAQAPQEIKLATSFESTRVGVWQEGNYTIHVDLNYLQSVFQERCTSYLDAANTYVFEDSSGYLFYCQTSKRYNLAGVQLAHATNGLDLRTIKIYHGLDNQSDQLNQPQVMQDLILHLVEKGNAMLFYKEQRIFTLFSLTNIIGNGNILNQGFENIIYAYDPKDYLSKKVEILGW